MRRGPLTGSPIPRAGHGSFGCRPGLSGSHGYKSLRSLRSVIPHPFLLPSLRRSFGRSAGSPFRPRRAGTGPRTGEALQASADAVGVCPPKQQNALRTVRPERASDCLVRR